MDCIGTVKRTDGDRVFVVVERLHACTGSCRDCAGCENPNAEIEIEAENLCSAKCGDTVKIETPNRTMFKLIGLVYIMPVVLMIAAFFITPGGENIKIVMSFVFLIIGAVICYFYSKHMNRKKDICFSAVKVIEK